MGVPRYTVSLSTAECRLRFHKVKLTYYLYCHRVSNPDPEAVPLNLLSNTLP